MIVSRGFLIVIAFALNKAFGNYRENLTVINEIDVNAVFGLEFSIR